MLDYGIILVLFEHGRGTIQAIIVTLQSWSQYSGRRNNFTGVDGTARRAMHIPTAPRMRAVLPPSVDAVSTLTLPTAARAFSLGFSLELLPTTTSTSRSCFLVETNASRDHLRR